MYFEDWYKKSVTLRWGDVMFDLAVAQELFSSHEVDSGSLLLLKSLDMESLDPIGSCLDYGCGYGVLGLALKTVRPEWNVLLVDRDALAVAFAEHNAASLELDVAATVGLDPLDATGKGHDLILWNVPGKAGAAVLSRLTDEALDVLTPGGILALVIVHPLAETVRAAIMARDDMAIIHESAGSEHSVIHARRIAGAPAGSRDGFAAGVFDREAVDVVHGEFDYGLVPVIGLPQYDGPDHASLMVMDALSTLPVTGRDEVRAIVAGPGVGHLPMAIRSRWPGAALMLLDRDLLALRASARALDEGVPVDTFAAPDFDGVDPGEPADVAFTMIPDQMRPLVMQRLLDDLTLRVRPGGRLVIGGDSTEVTRMLALVKKKPELRARDQRKRRGSRVAIVERWEG